MKTNLFYTNIKKTIVFIVYLFIFAPMHAEDFALTKEAAEQGNASSQFQLGYMYTVGQGVEQNPTQAVYWFEKAATQGHSTAQYNLGVMYENGQGVGQSYAQAAYWYQKAADQGDAWAQNNLGVIYEYGLGITPNFSQAAFWYRKSAEKGNSNGQNNLGVLYEKGFGVKQDYQEAASWYRKSANQGNANSQNNLGVLYEKGNGVKQDYSKAAYWYQKAAEQGNSNGQNNLGVMYENGKGVKQDYALALFWYQQAAKQNNSTAESNLGYMYYKGLGVSRDFQQSILWFKKAAEQGNATAQYNLGVMYENGQGINKDLSIAMKWYHQSSMQGNKEAQKQYDSLSKMDIRPAGLYTANQAPPLLMLVENSLVFSETSNNNSLDANENSNITFKVRNLGSGSAVNCEARIQMTGSISGITANKVPIPTIDPGKEETIVIPISTYSNTEDGQVTFTIEIYESNGCGITPFNLSVNTRAFTAPLIQVVDYQTSSTSGTVNKMHPFTLSFNLQNTEYGTAENVQVHIKYPSYVFVTEGQTKLSYPMLKPGETKTVQLTLFASNNYPSNSIPITIDVKEKYGKYAENKLIDIALDQSIATNISIQSIEKEQDKEETPQEIVIKTFASDVDNDIPRTHKNNSTTFVVIIANENYQHVASVPFAINDGRIFQEYCHKTLGIPEKNIKYYPNATFNEIRLSIAWLEEICSAYDGDASVILYYAGHGIPNPKDFSAYLLPTDGDGRYITTGYKLDDLYQKLGIMSAKTITVFLDACFSGANRTGQMLASERGIALKARPGYPSGNTVVITAAQGDQTALPYHEAQHGMFTYYLLKKLKETQGDVTLGELSEYIIREVKRYSVIEQKSQTPCVIPSTTISQEWQNWKLQ